MSTYSRAKIQTIVHRRFHALSKCEWKFKVKSTNRNVNCAEPSNSGATMPTIPIDMTTIVRPRSHKSSIIGGGKRTAFSISWLSHGITSVSDAQCRFDNQSLKLMFCTNATQVSCFYSKKIITWPKTSYMC